MLNIQFDRKQTVGSNNARRKASQSNTTPSVSNEVGSKPHNSEVYAPVNSFNSRDVVNHFERTWAAAMETHATAQNTAKSEMYKGSESTPWGNRAPTKGSMSTGADFLAELKKKQSTVV
ncbi:hypothetical protein BGZ76_011108 [Entomortierella beljakovae]|nr:hypothetical protein BGZ76_011108 [Entomortierella beljakovae]